VPVARSRQNEAPPKKISFDLSRMVRRRLDLRCGHRYWQISFNKECIFGTLGLGPFVNNRATRWCLFHGLSNGTDCIHGQSS